MSSYEEAFSETLCEMQPDVAAATEGMRQAYVDPRFPQVTTLVDIDAEGRPLVQGFLGAPAAASVARTTVNVSAQMIGSSVVVVFEGGDLGRPIIVGVLLDGAPASKSEVQIQKVGEKLTLTANEEIAFRCGEASITLTAAGRVSIRGTYVISRSSGYNKIKGAVVDIN